MRQYQLSFVAALLLLATLILGGFTTSNELGAAEPTAPDVVVVDDSVGAVDPASGVDISAGIDGALKGIQNTPEGSPWWVYLVYAILGIVMTIFGGGYLQTKAQGLKLEASKVKDDLRRKAWLSLQAYALERADARLQKDVWAIAKRVQAGELNDAAAVKKLLRQLGQEEKTELVEYFRDNFSELAGGNLFEAFGEKYIDQLIEWAANKVWSQIPEFAGRDTAETLVNGGAKRLLTYGITHAIDYGVGKIEGVLLPTEPVPAPE